MQDGGELAFPADQLGDEAAGFGAVDRRAAIPNPGDQCLHRAPRRRPVLTGPCGERFRLGPGGQIVASQQEGLEQ